MNEQQPPITDEAGDARAGLDRRKFLLSTGAVTAGAWAAPSILTIDRALGATGSPPCCPTETDAATVKGTVSVLNTPIPVRQNACLNDDQLGTQAPLPASLGQVNLAEVSCVDCQAQADTATVVLTLPGAPMISADALESSATCDCETGQPTGSTRVANLTVGSASPINSTTFQAITVPGLGTIYLNERPTDPAGTPGEFNAVHIVLNIPLNGVTDLKLASSKVTCA